MPAAIISAFFSLLFPLAHVSVATDTSHEITQKHSSKHMIHPSAEKIRVIYFTDPICSVCWGIEPQLRKLKQEYGHLLEVEYRMGGLLKDWSYNAGGISKPSDVAHHWDQASAYFRMPIDGNVWLEDPLSSSYPPSIAFKAAELQDKAKALVFLRELREMVFLRKKNITKWENITVAARMAGLDPAQLKLDYDVKAKKLFEEDLALSARMRVTGFPTMFFTNGTATRLVNGYTAYEGIVAALRAISPDAVPAVYDRSWQALFAKFPSLTTREFAELTGKTYEEAQVNLNKLAGDGALTKTSVRNGEIWVMKNTARNHTR
jgi:putative protein-disulfide isomerase